MKNISLLCAVLSISSLVGSFNAVQAETPSPPCTLKAEDIALLAAAIQLAPGLSDLSEVHRDKLAGRVSEFFTATTHPTSEQYVAMMKSWGGTHRIDPNSQDYILSADVEWAGPCTECAVVGISPELLETFVIKGFKDDGKTFAPWNRPPLKGTGCIRLGNFTFGGGTDELARQGAQVVEIFVPAKMHDGSESLLGMRWVFEPSSANWVPWHSFEEVAQKGKGICMRFY